MCGALCVMTTGAALMPLWCVDSLDTPLKVGHLFKCNCCNMHYTITISLNIKFHFMLVTTLDGIRPPFPLRTTILMGFAFTAAVALHNNNFGAGVSTLQLRYVGCTGSESWLANCPRSTSGSCNSGYAENAGVRCQGLQE